MNHSEYISTKSIDQLENIIELANSKIKELLYGKQIDLWVVGDYCNQGWFSEDEYPKAIDFMYALAKKHIADGNSYDISVDKQRYQPTQAKTLIEVTLIKSVL